MSHPAVEVIEWSSSSHPVPSLIESCAPGAPAYLILDPNQGSVEDRMAAEAGMRRCYKRDRHIIFTRKHKLADGRVVSVGSTVDPLVALL